jgi:hypothetical protein
MHPYRDWWILIGIAVSVVVVVGGWGAYLYQAYESGVIDADTTAASVPYNRDRVDAALSAYRARRAQFEQGMNTDEVPPVRSVEDTGLDEPISDEVVREENAAAVNSDNELGEVVDMVTASSTIIQVE